MPHSPTAVQQQRTFSVSLALICAFIAWHAGNRQGWVVAAAWVAAGAVFLLVGRLQPQWLAAPSAVWWRLLHLLGQVNSRIILTLLFFAVITPVGWVMRLTGWDALALSRRHPAGWRDYPSRDAAHYKRMF